MVTSVFSVTGSKLDICYWNINSVANKLESHIVMSFIVNKDIVILAETKSKADSFVPGFKIIHSKKTKHRCGGVIVLIKNYLYSQVTHIDISVEDQIWFQLRDIPGIMF